MTRAVSILLPTALALGLTCGALPAQDPPAGREPVDAVAEPLAELREAVRDRRMRHDAKAVVAIGSLVAAYDRADAADRDKIHKGLTAALMTGKLRPPEENQLYRAAIEALGSMGIDGARVLHRVFVRKRFPRKPVWAPLRALLVENIGRSGELAMVEFLCERASRSSEDEELAAVGQTLVHYAKAPLKVRREIVKALISKYGGIEASASNAVLRADQPQTLTSNNSKKTLRAIADKWNATLTALTHERFADGNAWQRWWGKNRTADWDAASPGK